MTQTNWIRDAAWTVAWDSEAQRLAHLRDGTWPAPTRGARTWRRRDRALRRPMLTG